ncbi:MAG TPA: hypothetical protein VIH92_15765 [Solirubrobacteraceae bacterium]
MATRTIVTSQPDVECEVCERRLLRGEQPDVFIAAGRRRIVCELCAPRAAHEGWMRETDTQSLSMPPMRPRRGRSLFDRLRQVGKPAGAGADVGAASPTADPEQGSYDLFDGYTRAGAVPARPGAQSNEQAPADGEAQALDWDENAASATVQVEPHGAVAPELAAPTEQPSAYLEDAVTVFNASEFPRRVAGVTRSLGAPMVTVRSAEHLNSVVTIVVAWELCWYRYEVDLSEPVVEAQVTAQGTELAELAREDRAPNAAAADSGALVLTGA